jgi:hypothetical protein
MVAGSGGGLVSRLRGGPRGRLHSFLHRRASAVDEDLLGTALEWEPSRGGALFPHLYAPLAVQLAAWVKPLPLGENGVHRIPELGA